MPQRGRPCAALQIGLTPTIKTNALSRRDGLVPYLCHQKDLLRVRKVLTIIYSCALITLGLILFGFFVLANTGLLQLAITSDRSMISWVILALYALATLHWLYRAKVLDKETALCRDAEIGKTSVSDTENSHVAKALSSPAATVADRQELLDTIGDELTNTHAAGHFVADLLLKLGLTGTVIGFILMLLPIGDIKQFDLTHAATAIGDE